MFQCHSDVQTLQEKFRNELSRSHMDMTWRTEESFTRSTGCHVCSRSPADEHRLVGAGWCGTRWLLAFSLPRLVHRGSIASCVQGGKEESHCCWRGATGMSKPCGVSSLHQGISETRRRCTSQDTFLKPSFTSRLIKLWSLGRISSKLGQTWLYSYFQWHQVNLG